METSEEELLENVTDESGNSYMIQRMTVDNGQLLSTEILQTPAGLVVDLGGDFIPVNYSSEDLLAHDLTDEDRNLAAALVAVQFSQQQKQQQSQQDGGVIVNTSLPSLLTTLDGKVQLGEQQVLLQDKQTGFLQIVDAEELYKQDFAKFDESTQQLQLIKTEEIGEPDSHEPSPVKKILPHKKRIPRKLKKNGKTMIANLQKCSLCSQYINLDEFHNHQVICQSNITSIPANQFACQICLTSFADQLEFFEHLKKHYEPTTEIDKGEEQTEEIQPLEMELVQSDEQQLTDHITILKADEGILQNHQGAIIKIESSNEEPKETFLSSILHLTCLQCNRAFRRQKFYEAHMRDVHGSKELSEFSETEDLMAGISVNADVSVSDEVAEIESDTKAWYRDEELHATEEDLKEMEAKEHVCQNCNQQFLDRGTLINHMMSCASFEEEEDVAEETNVKTLRGKEELKKMSKRGSKSKTELECDLCERKFLHRNSLVYHLRSHTEDRPYQCDQCGKSFFAASALKVHLRLHSGEKPYRCEFCGRHFRQWGDLKYHCISLHSDEKQYQCEYCGKEFARKYSLIVHRRIHTGEKNYRCEFCGKTFRASSYLQNHRRIHTGEKPHACEICGKRFRVRSDMKRHLRTHTKSGRPGRLAVADEDMKVDVMEQVLTQESEDTSESMTLLKEENVTAVQSLQYEQDGGLESIRDANTLYVHMPILIT